MPQDRVGVGEPRLSEPAELVSAAEVQRLFDDLRNKNPCIPEIRVFKEALGNKYQRHLGEFLRDVRTCPSAVMGYAQQLLAAPPLPVSAFGPPRPLPLPPPDPEVVEERRRHAVLPRTGFSPFDSAARRFDPVRS